MSEMSFREPNQVLWRGVRPGHNGTQVRKYEAISGDDEDVYEVSSGVTLFLTTMIVTMNAGAAGEGGYVRIETSGHAERYKLVNIQMDAVGQIAVPITFNPPLEIAAGDFIHHLSTAASLDIRTFIHGWEE